MGVVGRTGSGQGTGGVQATMVHRIPGIFLNDA